MFLKLLTNIKRVLRLRKEIKLLPYLKINYYIYKRKINKNKHKKVHVKLV